MHISTCMYNHISYVTIPYHCIALHWNTYLTYIWVRYGSLAPSISLAAAFMVRFQVQMFPHVSPNILKMRPTLMFSVFSCRV